MAGSGIYIATQDCSAEIDGVVYYLKKGSTLIQDGSPLTKLKGFTDLMQPVENAISYAAKGKAPAAPMEPATAPEPTPEPVTEPEPAIEPEEPEEAEEVEEEPEPVVEAATAAPGEKRQTRTRGKSKAKK